MEIVVRRALVVYAVYRVVQFRRYKKYRVVPRVQVEELVSRLCLGEGRRVQIVDVRSHGYYDIGAERIKDSIRIEPNNLEEEIKNLPERQGHLSVLHLSARSDQRPGGASAAEKGFNTFVIVGGLAAWRKAGEPSGIRP